MKDKVNIILSALLPLQYLLIRWISNYTEWIETYYSQGFYLKIAKALQGLFGWLPFSIGDIFYFTIGIWFLYLLYKLIKEKRPNFLKNALRITATLSIFYFLFNLFWALNYYRVPLYQKMEIETSYSTEDLYNTTQKLVANTNALHTDLAFADSLVVSPHTKKNIRAIASQGYERIPTNILSTNKIPSIAKNSLFSLTLSYMGYGGYFNPFTGEAQVNSKTPKALYAVTVAHEHAHQLGIAAENEANFIGVLASLKNHDKFIQYAGYSYALRYCLNELGRRDKELYKEVYEGIHPGVLAMYKNHHEFWRKYDTVIERVSKEIWDKMLKANKQKDGISSYSYIVALLVNFDKAQPDFFSIH